MKKFCFVCDKEIININSASFIFMHFDSNEIRKMLVHKECDDEIKLNEKVVINKRILNKNINFFGVKKYD